MPTESSPNMRRLEAIVDALPEAQRVDIADWDDHPSFRVSGKNFVFCNHNATHLSVKLSKEEAAAVVASDASVDEAGYGLGRHGWVAVKLPREPPEPRWEEITEWVRTSYTLVAPKRLARIVLDQDRQQPSTEA